MQRKGDIDLKGTQKQRKIFKVVLWVFLVFLLVLGIPAGINECYKMNGDYTTLWSAADVLSYYGTLLGATATIVAVVWTIRFSKTQQQEERILAAKPWLTSKTELLNSIQEIVALQNGSTLYLFQSNDTWSMSKIAPYAIREGLHQINQTECAIKYELLNVGGNSATSINILFEGMPIIPPFALSKDANIVFVFVLPSKAGQEETKYTLSIDYGDTVSKTIYMQQEVLIVKRVAVGVTFAQGRNDLLTTPKIKETPVGQNNSNNQGGQDNANT